MAFQSDSFEEKLKKHKNRGVTPVDSSQQKTAYGTYLGDPGSPRNPAFFGPEFDELLAKVTQRNRSLYGGLTTDIRESLASAGLLASGALPDALTKAQIGLGQQTLGDITNLFGAEMGSKRGFETERALQLLQGDYDKGKQDEASDINFLNTLMSVLMGVGSFAVPALAPLFAAGGVASSAAGTAGASQKRGVT